MSPSHKQVFQGREFFLIDECVSTSTPKADTDHLVTHKCFVERSGGREQRDRTGTLVSYVSVSNSEAHPPRADEDEI